MIDYILCRVLRQLPLKLANQIYFHCVRPYASSYPKAFEAARLKACPAIQMSLNPKDTGHGHIAFTGSYEPELTALISDIAREQGGAMLDVGSNFGYYSLIWCGLREENSSMAFEASPRVIPALRRNLRLNELEARITVKEFAVSDSEGELSFDVGPEEQTGWGGISLNAACNDHLVKVAAQRLDVLAGEGEYRLLKIDCEGADFLVLRGAERLLAEHRIKHVCYEENLPRMKDLGVQPGAARALLLSHGYRCEPLDAGPSPTEFHAWVNS